MKFDQLTKQQQNKVMQQAKKDYPTAFVKKANASLNDKKYQKWLQEEAIQAVTDEMYNKEEEVA